MKEITIGELRRKVSRQFLEDALLAENVVAIVCDGERLGVIVKEPPSKIPHIENMAIKRAPEDKSLSATSGPRSLSSASSVMVEPISKAMSARGYRPPGSVR